MLFVSKFRRCLFLLLIAVLTFGWVASTLRLSADLILLITALVIYGMTTEWILIHRQKPQLARFTFGSSIILLAGWTALAIHLVLLTFGFPEVDDILYTIDRNLGFN